MFDLPFRHSYNLGLDWYEGEEREEREEREEGGEGGEGGERRGRRGRRGGEGEREEREERLTRIRMWDWKQRDIDNKQMVVDQHKSHKLAFRRYSSVFPLIFFLFSFLSFSSSSLLT
jgi:hypothetical protein